MTGGLSNPGRSVRSWRVLRRMLCAQRPGGFTIIEVMIVLVVSAALFISAVALISGRQNQTAFDQSIRQIQSQIQQAIHDVAVGYFPDQGTFECTAGAVPQLAPGTATQGTNSGCIFLGKAMQFQVQGTSPEQAAIYTIAGLQQGGVGGAQSTSLSDAKPVLVAPSTSHQTAGYPNSRVDASLQNGLTTSRVWYNDGVSNTDVGAVAFVSSLSGYSSAGGGGAGKVDVVPVVGVGLDIPSLQAAELMNSDGVGGNKLVTSPVNPSGGVYICFSSGGTNQYGIIKIGGGGRELAVTLTIKTKSGTCS